MGKQQSIWLWELKVEVIWQYQYASRNAIDSVKLMQYQGNHTITFDKLIATQPVQTFDELIVQLLYWSIGLTIMMETKTKIHKGEWTQEWRMSYSLYWLGKDLPSFLQVFS